MKILTLFLQSFLRIGLIFFMAFVWSRYFFSSLWLSLLTAGGIAAIFEIIFRLVGNKKDKRTSLKLKEKEEAENMFLSLAMRADYMQFFLKIAKKECLDSQKKGDYILMQNFKSKTLVYPKMIMEPLSPADIAAAFKKAEKEKADKIVIMCGEQSKEAVGFAQSLDKKITILDKFSTYSDIYKYYDLFPPITVTYKKSKKLALKEIFAFSFNRSRTKGYFLAAFVLLFSTLFVKLNVYYCVISSILLVFALISYFNPYFNHKTAKTGLG